MAELQRPAGVEAADEGGRLVVVEPRVVENADHVFGNLFQRLYHGVSRVEDHAPALAGELADSAREVEGALQLLLDYIAPFPPLLERFAAADLARSLAQRVEAGAGLRVALEVPADAATAPQVRVDPSRLGRAFDLMVARLAPAGPHGGGLRAAVGVALEPATAVVWLRLPAQAVAPRTSIGELRWAVAAKLVEIHGGSLEARDSGTGEALWTVVLPSEC